MNLFALPVTTMEAGGWVMVDLCVLAVVVAPR